jgi:DNA polymerase-1
LKGEQERILKNFPIQGSAADMTKAAMVKVSRDVLPHYPQASLIMQIHDELIFEYIPSAVILPARQIGGSGAHAKSKDLVPPEVYAFQKAVVESMQNAVKLSVPVVVESSVGTNWSELK